MGTSNNLEFEEQRGDPEPELGIEPPFPIGVTAPRLEGEQFRPGSPYADVVFITNFDARPLNGHDFLATGGADFGNETSFGIFNFTVPDGRVAILRGFKYAFSPIFNLTFESEFTGAADSFVGRICVGLPAEFSGGAIVQSGVAQLGYSDFRLGQQVLDWQPTYIIADSGETLSIIVRQSTGAVYSFFHAQFYGNLLLKTGRPTSFEPGTEPQTLRGIWK